MHTIIDGILINVEIKGKENPTFVILHGWKDSIKHWERVASELSKKCKIILVDLPGFGFSSPPPKPFDTYDYARIITKLLKKLKVSNYTLLGHSFGGRIATVISTSRPNDVSRLILMASAGIKDKRLKTLLLGKIASRLKPTLKNLPSGITGLLKRAVGSNDYINSGNLKDTFVKIVNQDLSALFPKISAPTLIIWGDNDKTLPVKQAEILKRLIPKSKVKIVWGVGHNPHIEKPDELAEILEEECL